MDVNEIIKILKNPTEEDKKLIASAFEFAKRAHEGQERFSGEPYIVHPFETAKILAKMQLDAKTVAAGLLHDVCEDGRVSEKEIKKQFGEEVAFFVSSVTKLGEIKYREETELKIENLRKMFLAMARDIRIVLIKLADRLHNIMTLEHVPKEKQRRIAIETLEIYSPIANRLGMGDIKGRLEDLAFPFAYPEEYKKVMGSIKNKYEQKEKELAKVKFRLKEELKKNGIKNFQMDSRIKHVYSLFKKLKRPDIDMNIDKVYDLIAIRLIVDSVEECYKILGIIHNIWRPLPGKIKDYIATPKPNGYQSLHTTVFAKDGNITEIQVRTEKMHQEAEFGIAAHWAYHEAGKPKSGARVNPRLSWVNQLAEWQKEAPHSKSFLESLRIDFFKDRVFCFTPKGDVIDLPEGASAIDFAYAIHSDIGNSASGAVINGKYSSLDSALKSGDIVEIQTKKNKKPNMEWLEHAKTSLARKQIKSESKKRGIFKKKGSR